MPPETTFDTLQLHDYLERMRAGDEAAADAFLRKVCVRLERLARRMLRGYPNVKDWADTDDVFQSALLRLLHSLRRLRPESTRDFMTLAALHIRRELLDLARHFRRRLDRPGGAAGNDSDPLAHWPDPHGAGPADLERWAAFHEQVDQLPAEEREVVALTFYHGWTQREIAALFAVDERTVRRRWHSACQNLSLAIGPRPPEM